MEPVWDSFQKGGKWVHEASLMGSSKKNIVAFIVQWVQLPLSESVTMVYEKSKDGIQKSFHFDY